MRLLSCSWSILAGLVILAGPPHTAHAQHAPGAAVDASLLRLGVDSLAVFLIRGPDTVRTGTVWDQLTLVEAQGGRRLHRVYRSMDRVLGIRADTLIDDFPTLAPLHQHSRSSEGVEIVDYGPGRARGWMRLANGDSMSVDAALPDPVYSASSFDLVLRSAPLAAGWSVEIPAFFPSTRTVVPLRARVVGADMIGAERCWRVDADFAGSPVSFWIGEASRRLCRQVMHVRPGVQLLFGAFPRTRAEPVAPRA